MTSTPHLGLPLIAAAQAQKHVTHNEALFGLDALVHLAVRDRDLATPPAEPDDGDRYIVPVGAVGAWAGRADKSPPGRTAPGASTRPVAVGLPTSSTRARCWDGTAQPGPTPSRPSPRFRT
jgi:Protein of unknown function (DUF2793)